MADINDLFSIAVSRSKPWYPKAVRLIQEFKYAPGRQTGYILDKFGLLVVNLEELIDGETDDG